MESENNDIVVELDGKEYKLRRDFPTICRIERILGQGIVQIANRFTEGAFGLHDLAVIVEAGARAAGHKVKLDEIGEAISAAGIGSVAPKVLQYLSRALVGDKAEAEEDDTEIS